METWKFIVTGVVQGVCYRASVVSFVEKNQNQITGYAKNLPDGSVEVLAFGNVKLLEELEKSLWIGSELSKVKEVKTTKNILNRNLEGFRIY